MLSSKMQGYGHVTWSWIKWIFPNLPNSILPDHEVVWGVLGHFGKLEMCSITHIWIVFENSIWNYVKKWHEVRSKICLNLLKISLSVYTKISWLHGPISLNLSIFWKLTLREKFDQDLQISCWKFSLNHLASWWKIVMK